MNLSDFSLRVRLAFFGVALSVASTNGFGEDKLDFNRDIRPLLSNACYQCHGPDDKTREAGLRFDEKEIALAELESGGHAIVPGDRTKSKLYQRITAKDPIERMPPADSGKELSAKEIELIGKWIDQGAEWKGHWAFIPPSEPGPPKTKWPGKVKTPIDQFLFARLEKEGLEPKDEAAKTALIRRVTFDLTGLPPTLKEINEFLADDSPDAYEKVVDRLLRSPRYGEHFARYWLDAARYGDTHGLHLDNERSLWPYREWVIEAFNNNKPFDEFTIEQLAGDLLPNATMEQKIATGFNRCNVTTSEGGSIAEEYRVRYAIDRTETTATVWMGLTAGCAVCHDHKFDPISQQEFYSLYAYFNNTSDAAMDGNALLPPPVIKVAAPEELEREKALESRIAQIRETIKKQVAEVDYREPESTPAPSGEPQEFVWIEDELPAGAQPAGNEGPQKSWQFVTEPVHSGAKASKRTSSGLTQHFFTNANPGLKVGEGDRLFAYVWLDAKNPPKEIMLQFNNGNWEHRAIWGEDVIPWGAPNTPSRFACGPLPEPGKWVRLEVAAGDVGLKPGDVINGWAFTQHDGTVYWDHAGIVTRTPQDGQGYRSLLAWESAQKAIKKSTLPAEVQAVLKIEADKRTAEQQATLKNYFIEHVHVDSQPLFAPHRQEIAKLQSELDALRSQMASTMIMADTPGMRETFVLTRGQYDQPDKSQKVEPGVPAVLPALPEDAPKNRLALAHWLASPDHPLTARVAVNRYWQHYFGTGIVKTAEDFGSQGEWPSHPDLLDWLATEFVKSGWNVKHMQKRIVMSHAYRQDSEVSPELFARDPENRLIARGPRFRLDAEMIRDNALSVSGLLVEKIGGKSVKPYQPPGLWEAVGYTSSNTARFKKDDGDALYRRSVYTFWKRTSPPPSMSTFDAPSREACTVRRARTNTPLQALVLMNDTQFVEAARHLGQRLMEEGGARPEERIIHGFRLATARQPSDKEIAVIQKLFEDQLASYRKNPEAALKLITVGDSPRSEKLDPAEHAAWTIVGSVLLNLDETVTKG